MDIMEMSLDEIISSDYLGKETLGKINMSRNRRQAGGFHVKVFRPDISYRAKPYAYRPGIGNTGFAMRQSTEYYGNGPDVYGAHTSSYGRRRIYVKAPEFYGKSAKVYGKHRQSFGNHIEMYGNKPDYHGRKHKQYGHGQHAGVFDKRIGGYGKMYGKYPRAHGKRYDKYGKRSKMVEKSNVDELRSNKNKLYKKQTNKFYNVRDKRDDCYDDGFDIKKTLEIRSKGLGVKGRYDRMFENPFDDSGYQPESDASSDSYRHGRVSKMRAKHSGSRGKRYKSRPKPRRNKRYSRQRSSKIRISNLALCVTDTDVTALFGEIGPIKKCLIHFDRYGKSLGLADVIYLHREDALRAVKIYNGLPLDRRILRVRYIPYYY
ncbi:uncharacterized protein LOC119687089 [Teleopsis dalmanni]|uniref:uncharacterized protein LOC119687089 n=1 Tax=Teleopsis dalmanni TaxID=139649 RepID=UPI0018CD50CE|nr:uncharacterized protein LOC119687089 [Teleopsis dalmanni]XP_037957194.1 uncharacterized protein LOC119687089 [Teleopsis dalmanni]